MDLYVCGGGKTWIIWAVYRHMSSISQATVTVGTVASQYVRLISAAAWGVIGDDDDDDVVGNG